MKEMYSTIFLRQTLAFLLMTCLLGDVTLTARAQHVHIAQGDVFYLADQLYVNGNLEHAGQLKIENGALNYRGNDYRNLPASSYTGNGYVHFHTPLSGVQLLNGGGVFFKKMKVSNIGNLMLSGGNDVGVTDTLQLLDGRIVLGVNNLHFTADAVVTGSSSDKYIATNSTGYVAYHSVPAGKPVHAPVGNYGRADYTPVIVTNGNIPQDIFVNVRGIVQGGVNPDTAKGVRRVWSLWTSNGGGLDSLVLHHSDSLIGSQYGSNLSSVIRYIDASWESGPCPFNAEIPVGSLWALASSRSLLLNTATTAGGNALYSKSSDWDIPEILLGVNPDVCAGDDAVYLKILSMSTGVDHYSIHWDVQANAAGFTNVFNQPFSSDSIRIVVPVIAPSGIHSGHITVRKSDNNCESISYSFFVTVNPLSEPEAEWNGQIVRTQDAYMSYQWYINGQRIDGATSREHEPFIEGEYSVYVVGANGCGSFSPGIPVRNLGIVERSGDATPSVFPNPSTGIVYLKYRQPLSVLLTSPDGRVVFRASGINQIDISGLVPGVYMTRMTDATGKLVGVERMIKK